MACSRQVVAQVFGNRDRRIAGDASEDAAAQGRGIDHALINDEDILAAAFAYLAVDIEGDAFGETIVLGLHNDVLAADVLAADLRHRAEHVRGHAPPTAYLDIDALFDGLCAEIATPRHRSQNGLDRTAAAIYAQTLVAAEDQRRM